MDLVKQSWMLNRDEIDDFVPEDFQQKHKLLSRKLALYLLHFPKYMQEVQQAIRTMKYEEFLRFQIVMQARRKSNQTVQIGSAKQFDESKIWQLCDSLPFTLTNDQKKCIEEILNDLIAIEFHSPHNNYRVYEFPIN